MTEYFSFSEGDVEQECIRAIQEKCGWKIKIAPELKVMTRPPAAFMNVLDAFDPKGFFRKGFY